MSAKSEEHTPSQDEETGGHPASTMGGVAPVMDEGVAEANRTGPQ